MLFPINRLEEQAKCEHEVLHKERIMGQQTGDLICESCGDTFQSAEEVVPVEFRHPDFILSIHALRVALIANKNLKLVEKYNHKYGDFIQPYNYALIDKNTNSFVIGLESKVAKEAIKRGVISIEPV